MGVVELAVAPEPAQADVVRFIAVRCAGPVNLALDITRVCPSFDSKIHCRLHSYLLAKEIFLQPFTLLLLICILSHTAPASQNQPDVEILKYSWRKLRKNIFPSGKKMQEISNAHIDARIIEESRKDKPDYALITELESQKQNQVTLLDVPIASDKAYEYKFRFKNKGARQVISLRWLYVFKDAVTGKELVCHRFESKVKIEPGKQRGVVAYSDSSPPFVVDARAKQRKGKAWKEEVIMEIVKYSDGTKWEME